MKGIGNVHTNSNRSRIKTDIAVCIECRRFHYEKGWHARLPAQFIKNGEEIKVIYTVCGECKTKQAHDMCPACRILSELRNNQAH